MLGVGFGWNVEEIANHGVPYRSRREVARGTCSRCRRCGATTWPPSTEFFEPSWSWPKPIVRRRPCYVGGAAGPKLFAHVAEYAEGWIPIGGKGIRTALPALREACEKAGRPMARVVPFGALPTREKLDYLAELGIEETVLALASAPTDAALRQLDVTARFV